MTGGVVDLDPTLCEVHYQGALVNQKLSEQMLREAAEVTLHWIGPSDEEP